MTKRKQITIDRNPQLSLFDRPPTDKPLRIGNHRRVFNQPKPETIYLGQMPLSEYLLDAGIKAPFIVRQLLQKYDWSTFEARYANSGRAPFAPSLMLGLIVYGIQNGMSSLRGLERFARSDLGCMWVTGGICPDHSVIGQFIYRHHDQISGDLFEGLTRSILNKTGGQGKQLAGDGTTIEAACSHYGLLNQEAVARQCGEAEKALDAEPADEKRQRGLKQARLTESLMQTRVQNRRAKGQQTGKLLISGQEPEAMRQRQKRGRGSAPSYKPSVLANSQRIVVANCVDASSETRVIPALLDQSQLVTGQNPDELLLDSGYGCRSVIQEMVKREIGLLCPMGTSDTHKPRYKYYPKSVFRYDEQNDVYVCPAENVLKPTGYFKSKARTGPGTKYTSNACTDCTQKTHCTRSKTGRTLNRYEGDDLKDALTQVMAQTGARQLFSKRQAWVEPVFSALRGQQGLNRFRRKGLMGVKIEFSLHILAYNLSRAVALDKSIVHLFKQLLLCLQNTWRADSIPVCILIHADNSCTQPG